MPPYRITRTPADDGVAVLRLDGEFDITARDDLEEALVATVAEDGINAVELDMGGVAFLDSEALAAVLIGYNHAVAADLGYRLRNPQGVVRRTLDVAGVTELLAD